LEGPGVRALRLGASGVVAPLTEPPGLPLPLKVGGTEAIVRVDTEEGRPPTPRCSELAEAAATGGALMVTMVLARALFTAVVEL